MRDLKEVLEQNKEKYIEELKNLVGIDTHDLGHGIDGGLEKQGQEYMVNLFESMGADEITVDPMDEAVIQESYKKHQEGNLGHNQTDRANVYATFKGKQGGKSLLFNGHIDVMPAEMEDGWTNPAHMRQNQGIVGRLAVDNAVGFQTAHYRLDRAIASAFLVTHGGNCHIARQLIPGILQKLYRHHLCHQTALHIRLSR